MSRALDHALDLLRRGLSVFPVPRPCAGVEPGSVGDGKVPAIPWAEFQQRHPTEEELRAWFATEQNIAIVTGAVSGVVAVDADSMPALRWCTSHLPYTGWQTRTARGYHLFYAHPGLRVGNRSKIRTGDGRLDIDVRGDGGFVIGPGSLHASGVVYARAGDWSVSREQLPRFWIGWLERPASRQRPRSSRATGSVIERARRYLAAIPLPEIGHGSDAAMLSAACRLVRGFEITEAEAVELLWQWAGGRQGWTREWVASKVANAVRYGTEPMGALRDS